MLKQADGLRFGEQKQKATLRGIEQAFGSESLVFTHCFRELNKAFRLVQSGSPARASLERWRRSPGISCSPANGGEERGEQLFLVHTYLSILSKMLAYRAISDDELMEDAPLREIMDGSIFARHRISNFVEHDLFGWVLDTESFTAVEGSLRLLACELSRFDFRDVDEDVLKGVYQKMIDFDARRALGEYYTPDWLCERVVDEFDFTAAGRILDPSCGSGSFLRAVVRRIRRLHPHVTVEELNRQVHGIDIHPLSVQITKATLLLAFGRDLLASATTELQLNISLADTLRDQLPEETSHGQTSARLLDAPGHAFNSGRFDYIVGNPPWLTLSAIRDEDYQLSLEQLACDYDLRPASAANFPHLEIAAIFLAYCSDRLLRDGGRLAFVLPRSFFSADQHDHTRSGRAKGFELTAAWDLDKVTPLFRVPGCVLFAVRSGAHATLRRAGLDGRAFSGKLPAHDCNLREARPHLTEARVTWFYVRQGKASALSTRRPAQTGESNPYQKQFRQGATLVPRAFYFVDVAEPLVDVAEPFVDVSESRASGFADRSFSLRTAAAVQPASKQPWAGVRVEGGVEPRFLFRTALSKSILPFALFRPSLVVLPLTIEQSSEGGRRLSLHDASELRRRGYPRASQWFAQAEAGWEANKTEKSKGMTNLGRLDFQRGLTRQNLDAPYLVLYNSSAQDANAVLVRREDYDLEFIVESVAYVFYTSSIDEAYYLTALLNSQAANRRMKDFQARGLFGARHVHRKILDVYFPRFDEAESAHMRLARLGQAAHARAAERLGASLPRTLSAQRLGRLRVDIKRHLASELTEIDYLLEKMIDMPPAAASKIPAASARHAK